MYRRIKTIVPLIVGMLLGVVAAKALTLVRDRPPPQESSSHAGLSIEQVQALACLVTSRVEVSDVIVTRLDGYTGGVEAAVLLRGDFELGVDLSAARFEAMDRESHTAVLVLPLPKVSQPRVDHLRSRLVAVRDKGLWVIVPGEEAQVAVTNLAMKDAQRFVEGAASDGALVEKSKRQAEQVLGSFFKAIGWTVEVRWADAGK